MEHMWSPWRSERIARLEDSLPDDSGASLFTRLEKAGDDEESLILWRGAHVFILMNKFPYNNGHLLVVPYRQVSRLHELVDEELLELTLAVRLSMRCIDEAFNPQGYNVGLNEGKAAGASVPDHIHMHVVPRWSGDTNFMPTLAETRVLPYGLKESYQRLKRILETNDY